MGRPAGSFGARSVTDLGRLNAPTIALLLALVILGAAAYWVQANTERGYDDLRADPAYALRMPGADELSQVGAGASSGIEGGSPAFAGQIFGTMATSDEVYAFYDRELGRLGWRIDTPPYASSTVELANKLYCKSKTSFRLAIKDKDRAFQPSFYKGRVYVTVFDARLRAVSPSQQCPKPPLVPTTPIP